MIKLQSLGAVCGQQQDPALAAAYISSPLSQPLDEVVHRYFCAAGFQGVFLQGLV